MLASAAFAVTIVIWDVLFNHGAAARQMSFFARDIRHGLGF